MKDNFKKETFVHECYPNDAGKIYCRAKHEVKKLDWGDCDKCPLLAGGGQGMGVECAYEDIINKTLKTPYRAEPNSEKLRISRLIDSGELTKEPVRKD